MRDATDVRDTTGGCAARLRPPVNRLPEPVDEGELTRVYMAPLDSTELVQPFRDAGGLWWSTGTPLTSERRDGTNELVFARMDSHGQFQPVCPPCPCEEE